MIALQRKIELWVSLCDVILSDIHFSLHLQNLCFFAFSRLYCFCFLAFLPFLGISFLIMSDYEDTLNERGGARSSGDVFVEERDGDAPLVHLRNIPASITRRDLKDVFREFGNVLAYVVLPNAQLLLQLDSDDGTDRLLAFLEENQYVLFKFDFFLFKSKLVRY